MRVTNTPHDALFKRLFARPEHVADEARAVLPAEVSEAIDWSTLRRERAEVVAPELGRRHTDMLYRARLRGSDAEAAVWLAFEHRSRGDRWMPLRMLRTAVLEADRYRESHTKAKRLPLFLPIVVSHGPRWRGPVRYSQLTAGAPALKRALGARMPELELIVDDLAGWDEPGLARRTSSAFLRLGLWALRGRGAPATDRVRAWIDEIRHLADAEDDDALESVLRYHALVAESTAELAAALKTVPRGEEVYVATIAEGYFNRGREKGLQEGIEQGIERGIEQGLQEGIEQGIERGIEQGIEQGIERGIERGLELGRSEGRADVLRTLLEKRFGPLPVEFVERLSALTNGAFERYVERAISVDRIEDVFDADGD
ncbi:MAG: Rpn family recombination-promoting nuclease/putative transposase [Deltaproteobacteria bacterium]